MGPKTHFSSLEDLNRSLDHEALFEDDETAGILEDDDLALLHGPKPTPVKKPVKKKAPVVKKKNLKKKPAAKKPKR